MNTLIVNRKLALSTTRTQWIGNRFYMVASYKLHCRMMHLILISNSFFYELRCMMVQADAGLDTGIHTFHTLDNRSGCPLAPRQLLRCIQMRSVPDSQWKVFSSSQELREWMLVCGAVLYHTETEK